MDTEEIRKKVLQCVENTADANLLHSMLNLVEGRAGYSRNRLGIYNDRIGDDIRIDTNMIVPIICDDMFEVYDEKSEVWCSINDFVCSRYEVDDVIAEAIRSNFYYGMTLLEQLRNDYSRDLYDTLQGKLEKGNLRLRSTVREFLQHGNFPLIVTTFGFRVIEESLTRYKDGDRWFNPTVRNDIPFMHKDSWIVYHIFGGKEYSHWVYDEQEMLGFMHALHSGDYEAKGLSNYLRGFRTDCTDVKRPLVIGSSLPDWLFRFFLYPLYGDKLKYAKGYCYWLSLSEIENGLDLFLSRNKFRGQTNLRSDNLVDSIMGKATKASELVVESSVSGKRKNVFISYKRKDGETPEKVKRIAEMIGNQGCDVWIDREKIEINDLYWFKIKMAIQYCDIFMPLITDTYLEAFDNAGDIDLLAKENKIAEASVAEQKTNDPKVISELPPLVREAYYAIAYQKVGIPVILKGEGADETSTQNVFRSTKLEDIFGENGEKIYQTYDDQAPDFLTF